VRELDVGLFGKLFSRLGVSFADEVVHDDEVDVPEVDEVSWGLTTCRALGKRALQKSEMQVNIFSTRCFGEIPNL
jgi:hypothetical protein